MANKKFEIGTLNSANLVELDGFTQSQLKLVEDHPFIEISDSKSYQEAKKNRTALKTGRTTIEKQDKLIATTVFAFRKGTIKIKDELVIITKPHEEKQQTELDRWEKIIQDQKDSEAKLEEERIQKIKDKIETTKQLLKDHIDLMTYETIKSSNDIFNDDIVSVSDFDFQEYQFLFDEMIENQKKAFSDNVIYWEKHEEKRLADLEKDQQSKINEIKLKCIELCDEAVIGKKDTLIDSMNAVIVCGFDFGNNEKQFNEMVEGEMTRARNKIGWLNEQEDRLKEENITIQKNKVINTREGLLDLVFQMNIQKYKFQTENIKSSLDQDFEKIVPDAMEEVQKLKRSRE